VSEVFGAEDGAGTRSAAARPGEKGRGIKAAYLHAGRLVFVLDVDELIRGRGGTRAR